MSTGPEKADQSKQSSKRYTVDVSNTRRLERELDAVPQRDLDRIRADIRALAENPRPPGAKQLERGIYRIRRGNWRIIYKVVDDERLVLVGAVRRRSAQTYRRVGDWFS